MSHRIEESVLTEGERKTVGKETQEDSRNERNGKRLVNGHKIMARLEE